MINSVVLVGRLTKDVDLRFTPNGVAVATLTLAVNRTFTNSQGERETDFINCVIWRNPAENAANFLKKGSLAGVKGTWQTRNYEGQDGKRVYVNECLVESIQFLEPKSGSGGSNGGSGTQGTQQQQNSQQGKTGEQWRGNKDPFAGGGNIDISDDDLPF